MDRAAEQRQRDIEQKARRDSAWAKVRAIARAQGLAIVRISTRTYQVVKIREESCTRSLGSGYFTYLSGEIVCRGTHSDCLEYINAQGQPVPIDLVNECH